jgi:hypothetical protein
MQPANEIIFCKDQKILTISDKFIVCHIFVISSFFMECRDEEFISSKGGGEKSFSA